MVALFFQGCFDARCPLRRAGDRSGDDIAARVWAWVAGLDESPTLVPGTDDRATYILRSSDVRTLLLTTMYQPLDAFQDAAAKADAAMRGNATGLYDLLEGLAGGPLEDGCPVGGGGNQTAPARSDEAQSAILCGDGEDITGRNATFWRDYVARQLAQSSVAGAFWSDIRLACTNWLLRAKWQFRGPFTTPAPSGDASAPEAGKPAAPLLFLSNRLDPVTPLRAARRVAAKYPGAGLLVQDAMGHCVFGNRAPTECAKSVVRRYFDEGVVPDGETTCEAACDPWGDKCERVSGSLGVLRVDEGARRDGHFPLHI